MITTTALVKQTLRVSHKDSGTLARIQAAHNGRCRVECYLHDGPWVTTTPDDVEAVCVLLDHLDYCHDTHAYPLELQVES